jgi:hypothetical protein
MQRAIQLPDDLVRELERLAAQERRSLEEFVQLALGDYIARRTADRTHWVQRFDNTVEHIQSRIPPNIPPEDIEADITAAFEDVRARRAAERRANDAGGR